MHPGKFGVTEPTICLHHRAAELGRPIIQALDELSTETPPSSRMLTFLPSSQKHVLTAIPLRCVATRNELRLMHISCRQETVTVEMTQVELGVLRDALTAWCLGQEDFRVSPATRNSTAMNGGHSTNHQASYGSGDRVMQDRDIAD